jgi:hypothetical protein
VADTSRFYPVIFHLMTMTVHIMNIGAEKKRQRQRQFSQESSILKRYSSSVASVTATTCRYLAVTLTALASSS